MKNIVFVAPYFMEATERFILAAATTTGARLGLVSCDPEDKLSESVRQHLAGHYQVPGIDTGSIRQGVEAFQKHFGRVDRLLGMLEQIQEPLGEIRDELGIPGLCQKTAHNFRDKAQMKSVFRQNGVPCAGYQLVRSVGEGQQFAERYGFPIVIKPPDGAGSKATYRCESLDQLREGIQALCASDQQPVLLEQFVTGKEHSFDSVMINGELLWSSISHYSPGPLEVMREPWIQWCVMIPRENDRPEYRSIQKYAPMALRGLGLGTSLTHCEWFLQGDGTAVISEIAARPPGAQFTTLLSHAHGTDMYRAWARLMIHDQFDPPARPFAAGAAYLRGMGHGTVQRILGLQPLAQTLGSMIVEAKLPKLGQTPSSHYEGDGYIIVRHPETAVVEQALNDIIRSVRIELGN